MHEQSTLATELEQHRCRQKVDIILVERVAFPFAAQGKIPGKIEVSANVVDYVGTVDFRTG